MSLIQARYGADVAAWLPGNAVSFDCETTGIDPLEARIVTASCIEVGADGSVDRGSWLVDPGIEIPERATAIHGVSTAKARAEGQPPRHVLPLIITVLADAWRRGLPVIVMNAGYDLTLVQAEASRLGLPELSLGPVLDPLAIDRMCRKSWRGKRTLEALAAHYQVKQEGAHSARGDALTAARVVWKQARAYPAAMSLTLTEMQTAQADAHRAWAEEFGTYLRGIGKRDDVERGWPLRRLKGAA